MLSMKENEDDIIKNRFKDAEAPISPRVWDAIKKTLPEEPEKTSWFAKSNITIGVIVLLTLGGIIGGYFSYYSANKPSDFQSGSIKENNIKNYTDIPSINDQANSTVEMAKRSESNETNSSSFTASEKTTNQGSKKVNQELENVTHADLLTNKEATNLIGKANSKNDPKKENENQNNSKTKINFAKTAKWNAAHSLGENQNSKNYSNAQLTNLNDNGLESSFKVNENSSSKDEVGSVNSNNEKNNPDKLTNSVERNKATTASIESMLDPKVKKLESTMISIDKGDEPNSTISPIADNSMDKLSTNPIVEKKDSAPYSKTNDSTTSVSSPLVVSTVDSISSPKSDSTVVLNESAKPNNKTATKVNSKWAVGFYVTPSISGISTTSTLSEIDEKNKVDKKQFNYSVGGFVCYQLGNRYSISSGLEYAQFSELNQFNVNYYADTSYFVTQLQQDSVFVQDSSGTNWIVFDTLKTVFKEDSVLQNYNKNVKDAFHFISVPIQFTSVLYNRSKFSIFSTAGLKINIMTQGKSYFRENAEIVLINEKYKKVSFSYMIAVGLGYSVSEKISLYFQPVINYNINSVYKRNTVINQKPYSAGLSLGIKIQL